MGGCVRLSTCETGNPTDSGKPGRWSVRQIATGAQAPGPHPRKSEESWNELIVRRLCQWEAKLKHLEFIQGVINRLATDSFRMKGWAVVLVLVSALLVVLAKEGRVEFAYIGFVPALVFWGLDGYFLWQERLFRDLYDHVRVLDEADIDFSMDTSRVQAMLAGRDFLENTVPLLYRVGSSWSVPR